MPDSDEEYTPAYARTKGEVRERRAFWRQMVIGAIAIVGVVAISAVALVALTVTNAYTKCRAETRAPYDDRAYKQIDATSNVVQFLTDNPRTPLDPARQAALAAANAAVRDHKPYLQALKAADC